MKKWLINLLLGHDYEEQQEKTKFVIMNYAKSNCEKDKEIDALKITDRKLEKLEECCTNIRTKYHKLECDMIVKKNEINAISEELKECKEKYIVQKSISVARTKERNDFKDTIDDLKKEIKVLKTINQQMAGKRRVK